jgi:hypothetical protein
MLEDRLKLAITCRRLRSGPADAYIDDFADWLPERGYPVTRLSPCSWTRDDVKRSWI